LVIKTQLRAKFWLDIRMLVRALAFGLLFSPQAVRAGATASAEDYHQEKPLIEAMTRLDTALSTVESVRASSPLTSSLSPNALNKRLAILLQWVVRDYANSGELRLLSAVPEAANGAGTSNARLRTLQKTYWLQNNSLYGAQALLQYLPPLGRILSDSWRSKWEEKYPSFCPDTASAVVVGQLPAYDGGKGSGDRRCRLPRPGTWEMLRMQQYPNPAEAEFDTLQTPIIGTDYPGDKNGFGAKIEPIGKTSVRDLLKYGCLRQVLLGNYSTAQEMFDLALAQWDGNGFVEPKSRRDSDGSLAGIYWTRDLAFAVMCANALGQRGLQNWGTQQQVRKAAIEQKLWSTQSPSGGIWTNYCGDAAVEECGPGSIAKMAKQTNEIAPLVLLAYGKNIWSNRTESTK
jgi:hypothetical protein